VELSIHVDQAWLDYQQEIGLRHTPAKRNMTDRAATPPQVPLRYLIAFMAPVMETVRHQLQSKGLAPADVDRLHAAWTKAVILSIALWIPGQARDKNHRKIWMVLISV
jgi:hypothetical protein